MKRFPIALLSFSLLLATGACTPASQDKDAEQPPEEKPCTSVAVDYEQTEWGAVSVGPAGDGITPEMRSGADMPNFAALKLTELCAYYLTVDGAGAEGSAEELYQRFIEAPNTVLNYMVLIGDQSARKGAEASVNLLCRSIATSDIVKHESRAVPAVLKEFKEYYPNGRVADVLSILEREYNALKQASSASPAEK